MHSHHPPRPPCLTQISTKHRVMRAGISISVDPKLFPGLLESIFFSWLAWVHTIKQTVSQSKCENHPSIHPSNHPPIHPLATCFMTPGGKNFCAFLCRTLSLGQKFCAWHVEAKARLDCLLVKFIFLHCACFFQDGLKHKRVLYCSSDPSVCCRTCFIKKVSAMYGNSRTF